MSDTCLIDLPREMMIKIFKLLPPEDLKSVVLVCKGWKELGEDPTLWSWSVVWVRSEDELSRLEIPRLKLIQNLRVGRDDNEGEWDDSEGEWSKIDWIKLFSVIQNFPVNSIENSISDFWYSRFTVFVEPVLLLKVDKKLSALYLDAELTVEQYKELFSAIAGNICSVKYLELQYHASFLLNPDIFASAVTNVEVVELSYWNIKQQGYLEALFTALMGSVRTLRRLELVCCTFTKDIDPGLMGKAVSKLERFVTFDTTTLKCDQIAAILECAVKESSKLDYLFLSTLSCKEFREVDNSLKIKAAAKFQEFYSYDSDGGPSDYEDTDADSADDV